MLIHDDSVIHDKKRGKEYKNTNSVRGNIGKNGFTQNGSIFPWWRALDTDHLNLSDQDQGPHPSALTTQLCGTTINLG